MYNGDLRIRPWRLDDSQPLTDAVCESAEDLRPWMPWCVPGYGLKHARAYIEGAIKGRQDGTCYEFALLEGNALLGTCGLNGVDRPNLRANLGYWVRSSRTGQGIATAAALKLRDWAFEHTDLVRLEIVIAIGNVSSQRVAEKLGAQREGVLRQRLMLYGTAHDAVMYSCVRR